MKSYLLALLLHVFFINKIKLILSKISHFKEYSSVPFSIYRKLHNLCLLSRKVISQRNPIPIKQALLLPHCPQFLGSSKLLPALWIYLGYTFHINIIIQYDIIKNVTFCVWFLSLNIIFIRFEHRLLLQALLLRKTQPSLRHWIPASFWGGRWAMSYSRGHTAATRLSRTMAWQSSADLSVW